MNWTKAVALSLAIAGLGQTLAAAPTVPQAAQPAPSTLTGNLQAALSNSERQATTSSLSFDDARAAALAAMQAVIIESGEQPMTVQAALTAIKAETRPGAVALDVLRGRVQAVAIDCGLRAANQNVVRAKADVPATQANREGAADEAVQPLDGCATGLSVASTGASSGIGLFGPPSFTAGGSDYTPAP